MNLINEMMRGLLRRTILTLTWILASQSFVWGHVAQDPMKVDFKLHEGALTCSVRVHFSELYSLKRKKLGEVSEKDHAAILKSFQMNCSVHIDGKLVLPKLVSLKYPGKKKGAEHVHSTDEQRVAYVVLRYPIQQAAESIQVDWQLIPHKMTELAINFQTDSKAHVFKLKHGKTSFSWVKPAEKKFNNR